MSEKTSLFNKLEKKKRHFLPLRNDPPKVLAMGVGNRQEKGSKEGLIFKIPFEKLKNKSKSLKNVKSDKNSKTQKTSKIIKIEKVTKVTKPENGKSEKVTKWKS